MKHFNIIVAVMILTIAGFAATSVAGVAEVVKAAAEGGLYYGLAAIVLAYIFKVIPNDKIYGAVNKTFRGLGVTVTLGASRAKITAPLWNKIIEPYVLDLIENTVGAAVDGLIAGLKSDNKE